MAKKIIKKNKKVKDFLETEVLEEHIPEFSSQKEVLITKEGLKAMKEELAYLKVDGRKKVAERLKEAISFGDLSENSEYEEAKNEQAFVEGRIAELENKVKNAKIIVESKTANKIVAIGSKVTLKNLTKTSDDDIVYTIVGSTEADPFMGKISNESPVGSALLDKSKNDEVSVHVPAGVVKYKIVKLD